MKKTFFSLLLLMIMACAIQVQSADAAVYKLGSKGKQVTVIQKELKSSGYLLGKADGHFGKQTKAAVKKFQGKNKLKKDGIVGNATSQALLGKTKAKTSSYQAKSSSIHTNKIIENAKKYKGITYKFGGRSPQTGFDCSGYVSYVMKQSGLSLSGSSVDMYNKTKKTNNPSAGDLIFFKNTYKKGISHVGIYLGNNQFISASGNHVQIDSLNNTYWNAHYAGVRKL